MAGETDWQHDGCGGRLVLLTGQPIKAGGRGNSYIVFRCEKCGELVVVG